MQGFDLGQRRLGQASALGHVEGVEQVDVDGVVEDAEEPFVGLVAADLLRDGLQDVQLGEGLPQPAFAVPDLVLSRAQVQFDLGSDIGADRLGVLDAGFPRPGLVRAQLCDGLVDRGLADLVRPFDDRHAGAEVDGGIRDAAVVDEGDGMESHEPLLANR